jgi:hypothetical protein
MTCERDVRLGIAGALLAALGLAACQATPEEGVRGAGGSDGGGGAMTEAGSAGGATDAAAEPKISEVGFLSDGGCVIPNPSASGLPNASAYDTSIDGLVTDRMTGLMWQRGLSGSTYTHAAATAYCKNLKTGAYADWRLPTVIELVSLVDFTTMSPAIDSLAFPGTSSGLFWTATLLAGRNSNAWYVAFAQGNTNFLDVTVGNLARCVRAGLTANSMCYQPGARFQAAAGLVVDASTGLTWQQAIAPAPLSWSAAKTYCTGMAGGFRLPSLKELQTLVDYTIALPGPAIDAAAFPATPPIAFWSSSTVGGSATVAWTVKFNNGDTANSGTTAMTDLKQARCVH